MSTVHLGRRMLNPPIPESNIQKNGAEIPYYPFDPLPAKLIAALQDELLKGVDLFHAESAEMLSLGDWIPKGVPRLFVHPQIHFVYARRFLDARGKSSYSSYIETIIRTQEIAYLQTFDGIVTLSDEDRRALLPYIAPEKLFVSPFPIPADVGIARELPPKFNGRFLFVAAEGHDPNRDALEWMLAKIWPEILRQLPSAKLVVIGKWSDAARAKLSTQSISFTGFVSDLPKALRGGIMLVPLRIGSGIRAKILVALAQGVPVVTTSVGSEGMPFTDGKEVLVRDVETEFAAAAIELSSNPELWRRLAAAGLAAVSKHYSPEGVRQRRNEIYAILASATGAGDNHATCQK
jgi:glycosyltransferase involved in cell wall biosynthesis